MSVLTAKLPRKLVYGRHISSAACMATRVGYTTASSPTMVWIRDRCKGWNHKPCAKWNAKLAMEKYRLVQWSVILWSAAIDKHLISRLGSSLDRRGLHRLAVRDNGASYVFITGDVSDADMAKVASHYGYSIVAIHPGQDEAEAYLAASLSLENEPLNNGRKVQPGHGFKRLLKQLEQEERRQQDAEWGRSEPHAQTDSIFRQSLESDCEREGEPGRKARSAEPAEPLIQVRVLESVYQDWSKRMRADDRYEVWDGWDGDKAIYRWRGRAPRPSWGVPNTSVKGL